MASTGSFSRADGRESTQAGQIKFNALIIIIVPMPDRHAVAE